MIGITFLKRSALGCEMSMQYKSSCEVPNSAICARLNELSEIVKQRPLPEHEFSMRVPAELDRDADLVLSIAAQRIAALEESERRLREALTTAQAGLQLVADLIDESTGVAGLHLNGDLTPWDELRNGGRFDSWLFQFDAALNDVNKALAAAGIEVK